MTTDAPITLTLRVPGWCQPEDVRVDGAPADAADGWVALARGPLVYCLEQTGQPSTWPDASPGPRRHSVTFCRATRKSGN